MLISIYAVNQATDEETLESSGVALGDILDDYEEIAEITAELEARGSYYYGGGAAQMFLFRTE